MEKNKLKLVASSLYPVESNDSSKTLLTKAIGGITGCTLILECLVADESEPQAVAAGSIGLLILLGNVEYYIESYLLDKSGALIAKKGACEGSKSIDDSLIYLTSIEALLKPLMANYNNSDRLKGATQKLDFSIFCLTTAIKKIKNEASDKNVR